MVDLWMVLSYFALAARRLLRALAATPTRPVPSRSIVAGSGTAAGAAVNPRIDNPLPINPTKEAWPVNKSK